MKKQKIELSKDKLNGDFIYQISGISFDHDRLLNDFFEITKNSGINHTDFNQYNLHVRSQAVKEGLTNKELFFDFSGSLASKRNGIRAVSEHEFDTIHPAIIGSYTHEVILSIMELSPTKIGRIRWLGLDYKTCYSMHKDPDWYRLHIPIKTTEHSFFIVDQKFYTMEQAGGLYVIHPQWPHTAVNATLFDRRIHLVFDTIEETEYH